MKLPYDVRNNATYRGYRLMQDVIEAVVRGERTLALIGGGTGIGKTSETRRIARKHGIKDVPEDRPANIDALVTFFWLHRDKPVVLLDECDKLLRAESMCNMLKVCNGEPRVVAHGSQRSVLNEQYKASGSKRYRDFIPSTQFALGENVRQIGLTNKNYQDMEVIRDLPQEHWLALVGRGLDPIWIPTDGDHGLDLFCFTHWLGTEGNMLRSKQFTYDVSRRAIAYYVAKVNYLVDISPRRLVMIAQTVANNRDPDKCERALAQMLRQTDQRPKLRIPQTWVQVGGLLLSRQPPPPKHLRQQRPSAAKPEPTQEDSDPDPDPPPPPVKQPVPLMKPEEFASGFRQAMHHFAPEQVARPVREKSAAQAQPTEETEAEPPADPDVSQDPSTAIAEIDALPKSAACDAIADVLGKYPLAAWERVVFEELLFEALQYRSAWQTNAERTQEYFNCTTGIPLFCTIDEVLEYTPDDGLQILPWTIAEIAIAPKLAEAAGRRTAQERRAEALELFRKNLPKIRKLKVVRERLVRVQELVAIGLAELNERGKRGIAFIEAMTADDVRFAECDSFRDYLAKAAELADEEMVPTDAAMILVGAATQRG
jgi:hypothetical protein